MADQERVSFRISSELLYNLRIRNKDLTITKIFIMLAKNYLSDGKIKILEMSDKQFLKGKELEEAARIAKNAYQRKFNIAWRKKNKEHINQYQKEWFKNNPEKRRKYQHNYWIKKVKDGD